MGLLSNSRDFFTPEQAAEFLAKKLNDKITCSEILQLSLENKLALSVKVLAPLTSTKAKLINKKEVNDLKAVAQYLGLKIGIHKDYTKPSTDFISYEDRIKKLKKQLEETTPYPEPPEYIDCWDQPYVNYCNEKERFFQELLYQLPEGKELIDDKIIYDHAYKLLGEYSERVISYDDEQFLHFPPYESSYIINVKPGIYSICNPPDIYKTVAYYEHVRHKQKLDSADTNLTNYPDVVILSQDNTALSLWRNEMNANSTAMQLRLEFGRVEGLLKKTLVFGYEKASLEEFIGGLSVINPATKIELEGAYSTSTDSPYLLIAALLEQLKKYNPRLTQSKITAEIEETYKHIKGLSQSNTTKLIAEANRKIKDLKNKR